MNIDTIYLFAWTTILLGVRHSLDMDHIAAITDITAAESDKKRSLLSSFGYVAGHGAVTFVLGALAYAVGMSLPSGFEEIMEKVVGSTLVILAIAVMYSAIRYRDGSKVLSRWRVFSKIWANISALITRLSGHKHTHGQTQKHGGDIGFWGSLTIGAIHGIGVESPTQLVFLGSAAALQGSSIGLAVIFLFVFAMMAANMLLAVLLVTGFQSAKHRDRLFLILSIASASFGAYIGINMLLG